MYSLKIKNCTKSYDNVEVLKNINLEAKKGEFITLLGPSGCGKSTLLRIISGLSLQTSGKLYIKGKEVTNINPSDRHISMVFQSYALYPHLSVYENIATPLKARELNSLEKLPFFGQFMKTSKEKHTLIDKNIKDVAEKLNISHLLDRKPSELSGGQKQRVAIGRAMVRKPDLFLMDEPLSNLDAKLRVQMRTEIATLSRELKETFVYVTHDQEEAMTMSDKVAVMMDGIILQFDSPSNIYSNPLHIKVAEFIGSPKINIYDVTSDKNGFIVFKNKHINYQVEEKNSSLKLGVRPESFKVVKTKSQNSIKAIIKNIENLGSHYLLHILIESEKELSIVKIDDIDELKITDEIEIELKPKKLLVFDINNGNRIKGRKNANESKKI